MYLRLDCLSTLMCNATQEKRKAKLLLRVNLTKQRMPFYVQAQLGPLEMNVRIRRYMHASTVTDLSSTNVTWLSSQRLVYSHIHINVMSF